MPVFTLGELFCGPGGLGLAASVAHVALGSNTDEIDSVYRIEHAWANDYDKAACRTYAKNIVPNNPEKVICKSVQDLDIEKLGAVDGFAFGFPCNDFSIVGEQTGLDGKFGGLYKYGIKVLNSYKPLFFLAENVGGLQNANKGNAFKKILDELTKAGDGYDIVPNLYKFEEYGVPQRRHRIIIVGFRKDLNLHFKVPAKTTPENYVSVKEALTNPHIAKNAPNNELTKHPKSTIERLKAIPPGENAWYGGLPEHLKLNVKGARLSQIYKRLLPDEPAYTITGSGGGGTHVYHWEEPRALTNRERARIQTFPDSFVFEGSKEEVRKQIGMAVPPKGAQIIFEAILKTLAGMDYEYTEPTWILEDYE